MCKIISTHVDIPYPGIRQIMSRDVLYEWGDDLDPMQREPDVALLIPEATRYSLMAFLMARDWPIACDILTENPMLVAPWASQFLRDMMLSARLSKRDFTVFCTHIFVLDLAQTLGIKRTRVFLKRLGW
jgi:hypothetical protein